MARGWGGRGCRRLENVSMTSNNVELGGLDTYMKGFDAFSEYL